MIKIALDAMGGDNAPDANIQGAVEAVNTSNNIKVFLVGQEEVIIPKLEKFTYDKNRIEVVNAREVIATDDPPVKSIRQKKDSSIVVGMTMVRKGQADAFVSAGSSGAVLVGGQIVVGRIRGIERAPFAAVIPTANGVSLLLDSGANVDARASHLVQFAKMGSIYMENIMNVKNPSVALVNIGAEEEKGNMLVKETFPILKNSPDINFIGSIEAREIPFGNADVIVCEAFVGNVILKLYEGLGSMFLGKIKESFMKNTKSKIGALLVKDSLKTTLKTFDSSAYGGAPLLGLKGLVVKSHGNSTKKEIKNSILQCEQFVSQRTNEKIQSLLLNKAL
ncbi:phosphate acyltransferase PlsX [Acetitomaculum ruminis]